MWLFKKKSMIISLIIAILLIGGGIYFYPKPIIDDFEGTSIVSIEYNPYFGEDKLDLKKISNYNEREILQCIDQYKRIPSLSRSSGYSISDTQLIIVLQDDNGMNMILLGNGNYFDGSHGQPRFIIRHADGLRKNLLELLEIKG